MREEENNRSSKKQEKSFNVQRLLRKRWIVPAVYLVAAAGILSAVFFMQGQDESATPPEGVEVSDSAEQQDSNAYGEDAVEVTATNEVVKMPVANEEEVSIVGHFYDANATSEEQQEALVYYNNMYYQNKGIDFANAEGEAFDVPSFAKWNSH